MTGTTAKIAVRDAKSICEETQYAYTFLDVKGITESSTHWTIEGTASTPTPDLMEDIVEPLGAKFSLPLPFLWQHNHQQPIGEVVFAKPTKNGIPYKALIPKVLEAGSLRDRIEEAVQSIKYKLVAGASIGFKAIRDQFEFMENGGIRFKQWRWLELSAVTIPANPEATISSIKSLDREVRSKNSIQSVDEEHLRAALGAMQKGAPELSSTPPGVTGKRSISYIERKSEMATIAENIQNAQNKRAANLSAAEKLVQKAAEEGRPMDDAENDEYDTLVSEIETIDKDLVRQKRLVELTKASAKPVPTTEDGPDAATRARGDGKTSTDFHWKKPTDLPKGRLFVRASLAMLRAKGDSFQALENAKMYKDTPEVEQAVRAMVYAKAAVAAGNTTDSTWAAPLVVYQNLASEFIELLRPATILGRLNGVRNVPFNISIPRTTAGSTSSWVGEDDPKPVSRMSFETITLGHNKIATIVVLSEELVQDSSPAAESLVQADMLAAVQQYSDSQFIDPTVAASGSIRPASITNGLTTHNMTGTSVTNVLTDMQTLMATMVNADIPFTNVYWIMHPRSALYLSMLLSPLGTLQFPGINVNGGSFLGFPVITSTAVPIDTGDDTYIVLCNASEILVADSGMSVDVSREASLQMDSAPSDSAASVISLWQKNLVGLKCERRISYRRRRDAAVAVLKAVSY